MAAKDAYLAMFKLNIWNIRWITMHQLGINEIDDHVFMNNH